ncbi:MAG TPA: ABC transporter permease, partial [Clostridia bacterium]|nr:ABC transporter permease [Clostridia bacterium]
MKNNRIILSGKTKNMLTDNMVPIIFIAFTLLGFTVARGVPMSFFLTELSGRFYRNGFLVLSLIIPVIAGLGLNFGIVVGAMSAQLALIIVRYFFIEGFGGLLLCFALSTPLAAFFGYLTGKLYNKTRGQEMIASLIVGFFANGIYQFLLLFVVGVIIPVPATHPMIKTDGVGVRMTVDMGSLKYSLESVFEVPFVWAVLVVSVLFLAYMLYKHLKAKQMPLASSSDKNSIVGMAALVLCIAISIISIITNNSLMTVKRIPVLTVALIALLAVFTKLIMKTKLGQDFRSVG